MTCLPADGATGHSFLPEYDLPMTQGGHDFLMHRTAARKSRRSSFARAPSRSQYLTTIWSASFDLTTRKLEILATRTLLQSLSQNCSVAADAPPHRCQWAQILRVQVLAREHGAFFSHFFFCLVARERPGNPSPGGQGWHNRFLDPLYWAPSWIDLRVRI